MPRWSPSYYPRIRCRCCGSDLEPRSRTKHPVLACQNWKCREFDKPVEPGSMAPRRGHIS